MTRASTSGVGQSAVTSSAPNASFRYSAVRYTTRSLPLRRSLRLAGLELGVASAEQLELGALVGARPALSALQVVREADAARLLLGEVRREVLRDDPAREQRRGAASH